MTNLVYQCYLSNPPTPKFVKISTDSLKFYADKVGADYIFTRKSKLEKITDSIVNRYFNILNIIYDPWFDQYDDILYVDCDVIADSRADNIFKIPKAAWVDVLAISEKRIDGAHMHPGFHDPEIAKTFIEKYKFHGMDDPFLNGKRKVIRQMNTGVVLFTKKGRLKFRKLVKETEWQSWATECPMHTALMVDQPFVNAVFDKYKFNVIDLNDTWNMPATWFKKAPCPKSHFYHFSNSAKFFMKFFAHDHTPDGYYFNTDEKYFHQTPLWGTFKTKK